MCVGLVGSCIGHELERRGTAQAFQDLAEELPWSKHVHSKLVCALTREVMNEHNPPMVLPNGAVYSQKAIQQLASAKGVFTCPHTGALVASLTITLTFSYCIVIV